MAFREYVEVADPDDGGPPYTAVVRHCHDFPEMTPTGGNRVIVFDDRVPLTADLEDAEWPTETWGVLIA